MSLDFVAQWDLDTFKRDCFYHRALAEQFPAYDKRMSDVEEYFWRLGDWSLSLLLETWHRHPTWHAGAAVLDVPYRTDPVLKLEMPQPVPLFTKNWNQDHFDQARFLLAEIVGPLIRSGDKQQRVLETVASVALHWHVRDDRLKH